MELDTGVARAAEHLYALPRSEFTRARGEWVKQARSGGDRALADSISKLRRPTVAAWLVNQLARRRPDELAALTSLGEALRAAHEQLDGAALRELSARRREVLAGLQHSATDVADGPVTDAVSRELEEMFTGALAAEGSAGALISGRLSAAAEVADAAHSWPAVSPDARPRPVLVRPEPRDTDTNAEADTDGRTDTDSDTAAEAARPAEATEPSEPATAERGPSPALRKARDELTRAETAVREAEQRHEESEDAYRSATDEETTAHQSVARLRAELIAAEEAQQTARQRGRFARRQRDDADRQLRDRERKLTVARDRLAALEP
ncbi:MAG TPA: hypothetical protein VFE65_22950 [Pseudonocardia sp.]|jgi:hypothetical protein|nr:hypothetical protein [Pseudonocardia sp.]